MTIQYQSPEEPPIGTRVKVAVVLFFCSIALYAASYLLHYAALGPGQWMSCRPGPEYLVIQWEEGTQIASGTWNSLRSEEYHAINLLGFSFISKFVRPSRGLTLNSHSRLNLPYWPIILYFGIHAWPWIRKQRWLRLNQLGALLHKPAIVGTSTLLFFLLFALYLISEIHPIPDRMAVTNGLHLQFEKIQLSHTLHATKPIKGARTIFYFQLLGNLTLTLQDENVYRTVVSVSISFLMLLTAIPLIVSIRLRRTRRPPPLPRFSN